MPTFRTTDDKQWILKCTFAGIQRVKELLGIDLLDVSTGNPPLSLKLRTDLALCVDVVFCLIKPQADAAKVTDTQFGESIDGAAIHAIRQGLHEALLDFFQSASMPEMAKLLAESKEAVDQGMRIVLAEMEATNVAEEVTQRMKRTKTKTETNRKPKSSRTSGGTSSSLPRSSASTPARTRSGN